MPEADSINSLRAEYSKITLKRHNKWEYNQVE